MSTGKENVDNRIVKMEFDNKEFEKRVSKTLSSLDKLKKSLDFDKQTQSLKGLQNEAKHFSIDEIGESLERVEHKFSGFGIAGMTVMSELTKAALNVGGKISHALLAPFEQMKNGGWQRAMNIKDAEFALKGLGVVGEKLEAIKEDINYAVSGTAYGYDEAAKAASQLAASGLEAGEAMKTALRGISGVAAQTNSSYQEISQIFTNIAANNRVYKRDLISLSARGLNATATIAKALGTTEAAVSEMTKKGEIDFATFAQAMDDAFGEHATKANETFEGALRNMKAALSRIGANFANPIIDTERDVFNRLRDMINSLNFDYENADLPFTTEFTKELIDNAGSIRALSNDFVADMERVNDHIIGMLEDSDFYTGLNNLGDAVHNIYFVISTIAERAAEAWRQVFQVPEGERFLNLTSRIMLFTERMADAVERSGDDIQAIFRGIWSVFSIVGKAVRAATTVISAIAVPAFRVFAKVAGIVGDVISEIDYYFKVITATIEYTIDYFGDLGGAVDNVYNSFDSLLNGALNPVKAALAQIGKIARTAFVFTIGIIATAISSLAVVALTLYDALEPVFGALENFGSAIGTQITGVMDAIAESFNRAGIGISSVMGPIDLFISIIRDVAITAVYMLVVAIDTLAEKIRAFDGLRNAAGSIADTIFGGTSDKLTEVNDDLVTVAGQTEKTQTALQWLGEKIKIVAGVVGEAFETVLETVGDFLKQITPARIASLVLVGIIASFAVILGKILIGVSSLTWQIGQLTRSFNGMIKAITHRINPLANTRSVVEQFAITIFLLAAAMMLIASMDVEGFKRAATAVSVMAVGIIALMTAIETLAFNMKRKMIMQEFNIIMLAMVGFAAGLLAISMSLKHIAEIETDGILPKLAVMAVVMALYGTIIALVVRLSSKHNIVAMGNMIVSTVFLVAFALGIGKVVKALNQVQPMKIMNGIQSLIGIIAVLGAFMVMANATTNVKSAGGLILMLVSLRIIVDSLSKLSDMDTDGITRFVLDFLKIMGIVVAMFVILGKIPSLSLTKALAEMGVFIGALTLSVLALSKTAEIVGKLKSEDFAKGTVFVLAALGMFALLSKVAKYTEKSAMVQFGGGLLLMTVAINLLVGAVYLLGSIEEEKLAKGLFAVGAMFVMFAGLIAVSSLLDKTKLNISSYKAVMAVGASIIALSAMLIVLSFVPWEDIKKSMVALGVTIGAFGVAVNLATKNLSGTRIPDAVTIGIIGGSMVAIAVMLTKLAKYDWQNTVGASVGMAIAVAAFGVAVNAIMWILDKMKFVPPAEFWLAFAQTIALVALAAGAMYVTSLALQGLCDFDWKSIMAAGAALAGTMVAMAAFAAIAAAIGVSGVGVAAAAGVLEILGIAAELIAGVIIIGAILEGIDYLTKGGIEASITKFGDTLYLIGEAFGKLIGGFSSGTMSGLPDIGQALGDFYTNSEPFFKGMKGAMDDKLLEAIRIFSTLVAELAAIDMVNGLNPLKLFADGIGEIMYRLTGQQNQSFSDKFTDMFRDFGTVLGEFKSTLDESGLKKKDLKIIDLAADALDKIVELNAKLPNQEFGFGTLMSFAGIFKGDTSLKTFGANLKSFGKALVDFSKTVSEEGALDFKAVKLAIKIGKKLADFGDELPTHNGFIDWVTGSSKLSLSEFGTQMEKFGEGIYNFVCKISGLSEGSQKTAKYATKIGIELAKMADELPSSGGLFSIFTGSKDYSSWPDRMASLGSGVAAFVDSISDSKITESDLRIAEPVAKATSTLVEAVNKIPEQHSITGKNSLGKLGSQVKKFTASLKTALSQFDNTSDIEGRLNSFENWVSRIVDISKQISEAKVTAFGDLGDSIAKINSSTVGSRVISDSTYDTIISTLTSAMGEVQKKVKDFYTEGNNAAKQWVEGLSSTEQQKQASRGATTLINKVNDVLKSKETIEKYKKSGKNVLDGFIQGLKDKDKLEELRKQSVAIAETPKKHIDKTLKIMSPSRVMMKSGKYTAEGFIKGMQQKLREVKKASTQMGDAVDDSIRDRLGIHSPAWVTKLLGKFTASGFYQGLMAKIGEITKAGETIAEGFYEKVKEVMGPEAMAALGADSMSELENTLEDVGSTGGGGRGGASAAVQWTKKDVARTVTVLAAIFRESSYKYDKFNEKFLENGKITKKYLLSSFKDKDVRLAAEELWPDLIKRINKRLKKEAKNLKGEALIKKTREIAKETVKAFEAEIKKVEKVIAKYYKKDKKKKKKYQNNILDDEMFLAGWVQGYDPKHTSVKDIKKTIKKKYGLSDKKAISDLEKFGAFLYKDSGDQKADMKELESLEKKRSKLEKKAEKQRKITNDPKASAKKKKKAAQELESILNDIRNIDKDIEKVGKKMGKAGDKAIKALKKSLKEAVKDFVSFSSLSFNKVIEGFGRVEKSTNLQKQVFDIFSYSMVSATEATKAASDAFGILSTSVASSISLLERFSKVSSTSPRRLKKNAESQIKAYEEFEAGISKLRSMGLAESMIKDLEAQGPTALSQIRGFLKMSASEIDHYNQLVKKQQEITTKETVKSMEQKVDDYKEWLSVMSQLSAKLPKKMYEEIKGQGVSGLEFAKTLLGLDPDELKKITDLYNESIQQSSKDIIKGASDAFEGRTWKEQIEKMNKDLDEKNLNISRLKNKGFSNPIIEYLKNMSVDEAKPYIEELLKEDKDGVEYFNKEFEKSMNNGKSPVATWIEDMKVTNDTYATWKGNMNKIAKQLGKDDPLYKALESMGYESGAEYAEAFLAASKYEQNRIQQEFDRQQKYNAEAIVDELQGKIDSVKQWRDDLEKLAERGIGTNLMKDLVAEGPGGYEKVHALAEMATDDLYDFNKKYEAAMKLPDSVAKAISGSYLAVVTDMYPTISKEIKNPDRVKQITDSITNVYSEVHTNTKKQAEQTGEKTGKTINSGMSKEVNYENYHKMGTQSMNGLSKSYSDGSAALDKTTNKVASSSKSQFTSQLNYAEFHRMGSYSVVGAAHGMISVASYAINTSRNIACDITAAFRSALQIASPSKVMAELGRYVVLGLTKGMEENEGTVLTASDKISENIYDGFFDAIKDAYENANDISGDVKPVIHPTLDLSDVTGNVRALSADITSSREIVVTLGKDANKDVVNAISALAGQFNSDMGSLADAMGNTKIVMDTGTLVGELAGPMDSALGKQLVYKRRGVR